MDLDFDDDDGVLAEGRLQRIGFHTPLAREAALLATRMLVGTGWYARLYRLGHLRDSDILTGLGFLEVEGVTPAALREAVERQHRRLEAHHRRRADTLERNIARLAAMMPMSRTEQAVVRALVVCRHTTEVLDVVQYLARSERDFARLLHFATGCRVRDLAPVLAPSGLLRRSGLAEEAHRAPGMLHLDSDLVDILLTPGLDEARFLRHLVRPSPPPSLGPDDFSHIPEATLVREYLAAALAGRRRGVNILLHGPPGTGKTEFVRMLAGPLGVPVYEVPNCDSDGDPISGQRRFKAYAACQAVLATRRRQLLFFDEVEDVFGAGERDLVLRGMQLELSNPERLRKSWVNETLESNPVPAVWACNTIGRIDAAFLRRFDMVVEFGPLAAPVRRRVLERYLVPARVSPACIDRLARIDALVPAQAERAARVVRTLRPRSQAARDACAEQVLASALRAMGATPVPEPEVLPEHYDPAFINADQDLDAIAGGLARGGQARLCLYGPPGTGKTAFGHHLGRLLGKPVLVRRASDLLDPYLGGTEDNIRLAFERARVEGAILLIDEADSFLRSRGLAVRSWEVTQTNEMLTRMEVFDGIFIASTNLMESLDEASLRRFDFKLRFDYLTATQRRALLRKLAVDAGNAAAVQPALARLDALHALTPGDFANALRQLRLTGETVTAAALVARLGAEQAMKPGHARRGIGFTAH